MWVDPLSLKPEWTKLWLLDHLDELITFCKNKGMSWDRTHLDKDEFTKWAAEFYSTEMALPVMYEKGQLIVCVPDKDVVFYKLKA
jgi:hypothetical protein